MQPLVLCADVGGTQIKTGLLDAAGRPASPIRRADARAALPRQQLLDHMAACLLAAAQDTPPGSVQGVRLAMPGPFDYAAGICRIEGLGKYGALYNADLRAELGIRLAPALGGGRGGHPLPERRGRLCAGRAALWLRPRDRAGAVCLHRHRLRQRLQPGGRPGAGGHPRHAGGRLPVPAAAAGAAGGRLALPPGAAAAEPADPGRGAGRPAAGAARPSRRRRRTGRVAAVRRAFGRGADPGAGRLPPAALLPGRAGHRQRALFLEPLHRACRQRGVRLEATADTSLRAMQGALVT